MLFCPKCNTYKNYRRLKASKCSSCGEFMIFADTEGLKYPQDIEKKIRILAFITLPFLIFFISVLFPGGIVFALIFIIHPYLSFSLQLIFYITASVPLCISYSFFILWSEKMHLNYQKQVLEGLTPIDLSNLPTREGIKVFQLGETKEEGTKFCPFCKMEIPTNSKFCKECGKEIIVV